MFHVLMKEHAYDIPASIVIEEKKMEPEAVVVKEKKRTWFSGATSLLLTLLSALPWNKQPESETPQSDTSDTSSKCLADIGTMYDNVPVDWDTLPRHSVSWERLVIGAELAIPKVSGPFRITPDLILAELQAVSNILDDIGARIKLKHPPPEPQPREITNQEQHYIRIRRELLRCPHYTATEIDDYFGTNEGCGEEDGYFSWYAEYTNKEPRVIGDRPAVVDTEDDNTMVVKDRKMMKPQKKRGMFRRLRRWMRKKVAVS